MSEMVYGSFIAEAFNACMHVHMTDEGARYCSWIIRRADTCDVAAAAPEIKYYLRGLTTGISLVFLEYHGSISMFVAKTTASFF